MNSNRFINKLYIHKLVQHIVLLAFATVSVQSLAVGPDEASRKRPLAASYTNEGAPASKAARIVNFDETINAEKYNIYIRKDRRIGLEGFSRPKPRVTPSKFMNLDGNMDWEDSGYITFFKHSSKSFYNANGTRYNAAWKGIDDLNGNKIHIALIPKEVEPSPLNDENVRSIPELEGPSLFSTHEVRKPSRINEETGEVVEYADTYIHETLLAGGYPEGTLTLTIDSKDWKLFKGASNPEEFLSKLKEQVRKKGNIKLKHLEGLLGDGC